MDSKICTKCKKDKSLNEYHKKPSGKFGLQSICKLCKSEYAKLDWNLNKDRIKQRNDERYSKIKNNENYKLMKKVAYLKSREKTLIQKKIYYKTHKSDIAVKNKENSDKRNTYSNKYHKLKPEKSRVRETEKRLLKKKSSLLISNSLNKYWAEDFYKGSKILEDLFECKYEVDHIIPIKNKLVCGLHVPWNLQYLTYSENRKKLNKFDGTYDNESWRKDV